MKKMDHRIMKEGVIKLFFIIFPCLIASAYLGQKIPVLLKDLSLNFDNRDVYIEILTSVTLIFFFTYLNRVVYQLIVNKYVKLLVQKIRLDCYTKWIHAYEVDGKVEKKQYAQGEVITRILNDTESIRELITSGTFGILIDSFFVISCLIRFIIINQTLGLALTIVEVIIVILLIKGSKIMRVVFLEVGHSRGRVSRTMANLVGGLRETFYTRHEDYASKKGKNVFEDFLKIQLKANMWDSIYYSIAESLYPILLALMVLIFPYSHITTGALIFVIIDLVQRSISPIKDIAGKISNVQRAMAGAIRIGEFTNDLETLPTSSSFTDQELLVLDDNFNRRSQNFKSISVNIKEYVYPKRSGTQAFSLNEVVFEAKASNFYGIVGTSGCGKSTLFNIMAAKIYPGSGSIKMNFEGEASISFPSENKEEWRSYRQLIGLVGQDSHIFSETISFNLSLGKELPKGYLDEFFEDIKKEIPYIKEWGVELDTKINPLLISVGQKQLLAALRALLWKRPVILFDEIASALDSKLELALRDVINVIQKDSLVFIIAHRIETLLSADTIVAMSNGKIEALGKHNDLMNDSEYYKNFVQELMHSTDS